MNENVRLLLTGLVNEHILRVLKDLKRPDLTEDGRRKYQGLLADANEARLFLMDSDPYANFDSFTDYRKANP